MKDDGVFVAIYCRLSEEDRDKQNEQDDSISIQNQKSMLISYAQRNDWQIYKIYSDDNYTGADRSRPAFNELLKDAEAGKFKIVLCKTQSRFTREMELVEKYLHTLFPIWGIRFVSIVDNADTAVKSNKKARQINGLINEWYLEDLSDNIKTVLTDRRKKGFHIGAFAAYGYIKDPEYKGHLLPDPDAAKVVHRIFEMFSSGMGKSAIARQLNAEGILNPTAYKLQKGIRKKSPKIPRGTLWQYYVIDEILRNEVYIGHMVQGKYGSISYKTHQNKPRPKQEWIRVENTHAPIIERELWENVQEILKDRAKPGWSGEVGIFAQKAKCLYCGYSMRSKRTSTGLKYLACGTRIILKDACQGGFIGQKELEDTVLEQLHMVIQEYLDMDAAERQLVLKNEWEDKSDAVKRELVVCRNKLQDFDTALKMLYFDRTQGNITLEEFKSLSAGIREDIRGCKEKQKLLQKELESAQNHIKDERSKREILQQCADITELNYTVVNTLIDCIEVGRREGHYRNNKVPVVIHWKF